MTYGHAATIIRAVDKPQPELPALIVSVDVVLTEAADGCTQPIGIRHYVDGGLCGVWAFTRGQRIPGTDDTFAVAKCSRCGSYRHAVLPANGRPRGGPVYAPIGDLQ